MANSQLQREFQQKDVQRLRNLITEKYGDKTGTQVGHEKEKTERVEGDVWEESGKTWTIKDGLRQTYTKFDDLKKALRIPFCCPKCKKAMKHTLDNKFYGIHKECYSCVIERETLMRLNGTYQEYADNLIIKSTESFIDEAVEFIDDYAKQSDDIFYTEEGEKEIFVGGSLKHDKVEEWKRELIEIKERLSKKKNENSNPQ